MVSLETAENALKDVYLGVVKEQIALSTSPLYSMIKHTTKDIFGKDIVKAAPYGVTGGFCAAGETDPLPYVTDKNYLQFRATLKNLYGRFDISDKAVRASMNAPEVFVNLLADEMDSLVKSCSFNLNRMLYGKGDGIIADVTETFGTSAKCNTVRGLMPGMIIKTYDVGFDTRDDVLYQIVSIDRENNSFEYKRLLSDVAISAGSHIVVQNSYQNELTGLEALFSEDVTTLYGLTKSEHSWLKPYQQTEVGEISDIKIQTVIDYLAEYADSNVDYIATSSKVRRAYQQYLNIYRKNIDIVDIGNGVKTITHNGTPIYADKFVQDDVMYFLNTQDFVMHELCDWQWMSDETGRILRQTPNYPTYTGTLVKYAELMCDRPIGQGKLSGITFTVEDPYKTYIPE